MNDRDFLIWLHERLVHTFGVDSQTDYMHKLRAIIFNTEPSIHSLKIGASNIHELIELLKKKST